MIPYTETNVILAVIGLIGIIGTSITIGYAFAQNRREELKLKRRAATYRFDQDLLG